MVTLHILKLLEDNGFGTINADLFFEKLPLGKQGVAIFSRGGASSYGRRSSRQRFDLYCRGSNDVTGNQLLDDIKTFMQDSYGELCDLPVVPDYSDIQYKKARITVIDNIENIGLDENDRVIYRLGAQIIYEKSIIEGES